MIAVALLALVLYWPWGLYPPNDLSHAVFRVAVCLAAAGGIAIPRARLARWGLGLWALGITTSVILALDPWRAMWSTHNRQEGAWQVAHYLLLVLVAAATPRERLTRWLAITAALAVMWGIHPTIGWVNGWLVGPTGNPLYLAPLLVVGVWAAYRVGQLGDGEKGRRAAIGAVGIGQAAVRVSEGLQTVRGQNTGAAPLAGSSPALPTNWGWNALAAVLALGAAATGSKGVAVAAIAAAGVLVAHRAPRWAIPVAGACLAGAVWLVPMGGSALIRLELGRVAAHGIVSAPWGWGAEGFPYVWDEFWRGVTATGEVWHDRVHCLVLDRAIEWGVVGAAGFVAVVWAAWRRAELPERMVIAAYLGYSMTMFEMMWGGAAFAVVLGYTLRGSRTAAGRFDPSRTGIAPGGRLRPFWVCAALALTIGAAQLSQSWAGSHAADHPTMQRAIEQWSPVGGDLIEVYLKAPQTRETLEWADDHIEFYSPHRTQQAFLMAIWDRAWCADLRLVAPKRPDVRALCVR